MQDERSLVSRAQKRDSEAFAQLYEQYFNKIYRYVALKIGDQWEAEDLTQQVFLNAFQSIGSYKERGSPFASWLFRIAHNQVVDYLRKRKVRELPLEEARTATQVNPMQLAEQRLRVKQLWTACEKLPELQREVISLRFAGELSPES